MANIFLTRKCNLHCPYCFANEFVNKENEEFSIENFNNVLEFIKKDGEKTVGLIGGEPTVHSKFSQILDILVSDNDIENVVIYTNGLELHKYKSYWNNTKFHFLINCNSPEDIGVTRFEILKSNIKLMNEITKQSDSNIKRLFLGINLYKPDMDYSYIFDLLKSVNMHGLRFSTALTNEEKEETENVFEKIKRFKPLLFSFYKDCLKNEISPHNDCNAMPSCLFSLEDKKILLQFTNIANKYNVGSPIQSSHLCTPTVDILPDMTAIRCLGLSKHTKIEISQFSSLSNLKSYYFNNFDIFARTSFLSPSCMDCKSRIFDKCGVCFSFKLQQIERTKECVIKEATCINNQ